MQVFYNASVMHCPLGNTEVNLFICMSVDLSVIYLVLWEF